MKHSRKQLSQAKKRISLKELAAPPIGALTSRFSSSKLILTHPGSRCRTLLLASLIEDSQWELYYYDLGTEDASLAQFLTGLIYGLSRQSASFGSQTREALASGTTGPVSLAEMFAHDLERLSADDYLLILDEVDRADGVAEIQTFLEKLLDFLPAQCHLLISSRTLLRLSWAGWVASGQAVILHDAGALPGGFYAENISENPTLEVRALGSGFVLLNGRLVEAWQGHIQQMMFFFALDRPLSTRDDICQALWPELSTAQAVNVFHVTKRRLHSVFGFDVLLFDGLHYQVNPRLKLHYDVLEFVTSLVEARNQPGEEAGRHWRRAIELYRGGYLQGNTEIWIEARRADFREGYVEALQGLAVIREGQGQDESALGLLLRALSEAYQREDLHREVIRLYGKLGRKDEAAAHYTRLADYFKEQYNIEPSPKTQEIYRDATG